MSYILDALTKVERGRRRAPRVPTLDTVHQPAPGRGRRWWPWAVAAALVLNAAVLAVLLYPSPAPVVTAPSVRSAGDLPSSPPAGAAESRAPGPPSERPSGDETRDAGLSRRLETSATAAPEAPAAGEPVAAPVAVEVVEPPASDEPVTLAMGPRASTVPPPPDPPVAPRAEASVVPDVGDWGAAPASAEPAELAKPAEPDRTQPPVEPPRGPAPARPAEPTPAVGATRPPERQARVSPRATSSTLRDAISKMRLEVLVYAEQSADRFVFINSQKYVEGQRVQGRFVLEEITEEGAVLSHEGDRALLRPGSYR